ncbi:stage II sporulation protein M [Streptosporangiaceae bacterium NEAU-GS5]|nr:stage II sporulation protein M [Streptosporangiaceae bacterium NEAU-GS5]
MDIDAFVTTHQPTWDRLERLVRKRRSLSGAEVDELVELYQRVATHLSIVRSGSRDPVLVGRLSSLVAKARSAVTGAHAPAWREFLAFWTESFPVVAYRAGRWWLGAALGSIVVAVLIGAWVAGHPEVRAAIGTPEELKQLVEHDFADYYSQNPAGSFATEVWINNAWVSAQCVASSILLGIPIPYLLFENAANGGVLGGIMTSAGKADVFWGLIIPHGLLELTAVFLAAGAGMKVGWTVIDPGGRPRGQAVAEQGRAVVTVILGLIVVLLVSGLIEALVTPSPLPTWARIAIGVLAEAAFLTYIVVFGRRAARSGATGDIAQAPDYAPSA